MRMGIIMIALTLLAAASVEGFSVRPMQPALRANSPRLARFVMQQQQDDDKAAQRKAELDESDVDSADAGPKVLMPPEEMLNVMPGDADSFSSYLLPYAGLVLLALVLASFAFAALVLAG